MSKYHKVEDGFRVCPVPKWQKPPRIVPIMEEELFSPNPVVESVESVESVERTKYTAVFELLFRKIKMIKCQVLLIKSNMILEYCYHVHMPIICRAKTFFRHKSSRIFGSKLVDK